MYITRITAFNNIFEELKRYETDVCGIILKYLVVRPVFSVNEPSSCHHIFHQTKQHSS